MNYFELFELKNPYLRFKNKTDLKEVMHGWTGEHIFFREIIEKTKPATIIEIGSFMGQSTINMAKSIKQLKLQSQILCIDTWLGSPEHWRNDLCNCMNYYNYFENGISFMYDQFIVNMIVNNIDDIVFPIPNTSVNAFEILKWKNIKADLIYVDGSHNKNDVYNDICSYSKLLSKDGVLFGDDYFAWESVRNGVRKAAKRLNKKITTYHNNFWAIK